MQTNDTNSSDDVAKTIFAWIGIIVVVLVVGTIIISVLNEILPYNWGNKYRYNISCRNGSGTMAAKRT